MAAVSDTPQSFSMGKSQRALEAQQAMLTALKQEKYDEALSHAETAAVLDPSNAMVQEFLRVLQEKAALADDDSDEGNGMKAVKGTAGSTAAAEGEENSSSSESDSEEDDSEESTSSEEEQEPQDPAVTAAATRLRASFAATRGGVASSVNGITAGVAGLRMSTTDRKSLKSLLAASIQDMKEKEAAKAIIADNPLLSC